MKVYDFYNHFMVTIDRDHWHRRNTEAVKSCKGYKWVPAQKAWWVPGDARTQVLQWRYTHKAQIVPGDESLYVEVLEYDPMRELSVAVPVRDIVLRHYQEQGVAQGMFLKRFINGDDMGLGKTIQSISTTITWHSLGEDVFPQLIICPASLKENWKVEIEKFTNYHALILNDKVINSWPNHFNLGFSHFFIVNYESLSKFFVRKWPAKKDHRASEIEMSATAHLFKSIIIDESHKVKDATTRKTKLCLRLAHKKEFVILLSGTPVVNSPADLFAQISIMGHNDKFALTEKSFKDKFCKLNKVNNAEALKSRLYKYCYFRREKTEVAKELPEKTRQKLICEISNREEYNRVYSNFTNWLTGQNMDDEAIQRKLKAEILVRMGVLRKISALGKIYAAKEFIDDVLDGGHKLVVFIIHTEIVHELKKIYPHAVSITGEDDTTTRHRNVTAFQNDPACNLIICNINAGGVGITLTAASRELFIEYPWTYAGCVQAEDRCYRIGQVWPVCCTYLLGIKTIDEQMLDIILAKKELAQSITGSTDQMEMSVIDGIMSLFKQTILQ